MPCSTASCWEKITKQGRRGGQGGGVRFIFVMLALLLARMAAADVYTCQDDQGHKVFSQQPCGKDAQVVTTQGMSGSITVQAHPTPEMMLATCKMAVRGVDLALQLAKERIDFNSARQRVFGFMRDHISNFQDVVQKNPNFRGFLENNANNITVVGYRAVNASVTDDELNELTASCTKSAEEKLQNGASDGLPRKTGDKEL